MGQQCARRGPAEERNLSKVYVKWTFLFDVLVLFWVVVYVMVEITLTGKRPALFGGTRPVPGNRSQGKLACCFPVPTDMSAGGLGHGGG